MASLLKETFQGKEGQKNKETNKYINAINEMFNFRFKLFQGICPSDNMTLPQKEIILFGMKVSSFVNLFLFFLIVTFVSFVGEKFRRRVVSKSEEDESKRINLMKDETDNSTFPPKDETGRISITSRLKLTFIKFLKLYFTPVTVACFKLTHCVNINSESRLYVYADQICYTSWQFVIFAVLIPSILLFPICFEVALRLLKRRRISTSQFILSSGCPIIALTLYFYHTKVHKDDKMEDTKYSTEEEETLREIILMNEEELFKKQNDSIGWQIVQVSCF